MVTKTTKWADCYKATIRNNLLLTIRGDLILTKNNDKLVAVLTVIAPNGHLAIAKVTESTDALDMTNYKAHGMLDELTSTVNCSIKPDEEGPDKLELAARLAVDAVKELLSMQETEEEFKNWQKDNAEYL